VLIKPVVHEPKRPPRQETGEHLAGLDHDQRLITGIARMKMRRRMIDELHLDHDPVELADPRHALIVSKLPDAAAESTAGCRNDRGPPLSILV
jgi:hypothetical protein